MPLSFISSSVDLVIHSGEKSNLLISDVKSVSHVDFARRITIHDNAHLQMLIVITKTQESIIEIELDLLGDGTQANVVILYALSGDQKVKINSVQRHLGKNTVSSFVARGIISGCSQVSYHGLISMQPGSIKADGTQGHTTIVLGKQAKVVSVPSIEVLHHDVKCSHGAAMGQFQKEHLWYLESRGFEAKSAYQMLVHSFFAEYVREFTVDDEKSNSILESLCQAD